MLVVIGRYCAAIAFARRLKERTLSDKSSDAQVRAEASFKKAERAKDGAKAMMEYQANGRIEREKMARLRALRLAKEAADQKQEPAAKLKSGKAKARAVG
jgi:hypothetical protein